MELEVVKKTGNYSLDVFKQSWLLGARQFIPLVIAWALTLAGPLFIGGCTVTLGLIADKLMGFNHPAWASLLGLIIPVLLIGWFWAGWIYVTLKIARGISPKFTDLFRPVSQCSSAFLVLLGTSILIGLGMMCFVLPGAYLFLKFQFAPYYIVDRDMGPLEAVKQSWRDTDRLFVPLAFLDLGFWALHMVSGAIFIGPFLCFMAQQVASAIAYNKWLVDEDVSGLTDTLYKDITSSKPPVTGKSIEQDSPPVVMDLSKQKENETLP